MTLPEKNDGRDGGMEVSVREDERVKRSVGMATGRVRAGFFHTRTQLAGQDPWPGPGLFTKQVFFRGPNLPSSGPTGSVQLGQI